MNETKEEREAARREEEERNGVRLPSPDEIDQFMRDKAREREQMRMSHIGGYEELTDFDLKDGPTW